MQHKYVDRSIKQELNLLLQKGYTRVQIEGKLHGVQDVLEQKLIDLKKTVSEFQDNQIQLLIDRFTVKLDDEDNKKRIADSIQTAFYESEGECIVDVIDKESKAFNNRFELDGMEFLEPTPHLFNFNNPYGACPKCEGYGKVHGH